MQNEKGITADWRERIAGKKVIFYNTGVASLLNSNEKHIDKMNYVFDEFQKHSDMVLWWRPHPLEMTTLDSMRASLKNYYVKTKQRFIDENIGILDESSDLDRAIAVSDAYYGGTSSVTQLFLQTNKPVMFHDLGAKRMWESICAFYCTEYVDNKIIIAPVEGNFMMCFDVSEKKFEISNNLPITNDFVQICAIQDMAVCQNNLIIAGYNGTIMKGKTSDLNLKCLSDKYKCIFSKIIYDESSCFFLADNYDSIVMYDQAADELTDIKLNKTYNMVDGVIDDKNLYILAENNTIIQFDINNRTIKYFYSERNANYYMIEEHGKNIWLFGDDNAISLDKKTMDAVACVDYPETDNTNQILLFKSQKYNEKCYLIHYPRVADKRYTIFEFDFANCKISEFQKNIPGCYNTCIVNDKLFLAPCTGGLISISLDDKEINEYYPTSDEEKIMNEFMLDNLLKYNSRLIFKESAAMNFEILFLLLEKIGMHREQIKHKNVGKLIYEIIKEQ